MTRHLASLLVLCCVISTVEGLSFMRKPAAKKQVVKKPQPSPWLKKLTRPSLTPELQKKVAGFVKAQAQEKSIQQDLVAALWHFRAGAKHPGGSQPTTGSGNGLGDGTSSPTPPACATGTSAPSFDDVEDMVMGDVAKNPECQGEGAQICECVVQELVGACYPWDCADCVDSGFQQEEGGVCDYLGAPDGPGWCECKNDFEGCAGGFKAPMDPVGCENASGAEKREACASMIDLMAYCCMNPSDCE